MSVEAEGTMSFGGIDLREMQAAYAEHPELVQWRQTSQTVIRDYVEANAALGARLREAQSKEADLERHIAVVEEHNAALRRELEPEDGA
jgi:hypothetical protein